MKIEVLYVAECSSHPAAVKLVRDVLSSEGLAAEVRDVLVTDEVVASALRFRGSPTIRIDGRDVAGEPAKMERFGLSNAALAAEPGCAADSTCTKALHRRRAL